MNRRRDDIFGQRDAIKAIARRHGAYDVRLIGSVARDEASEGSDVDFVVRFEPGRSLLDHGGLLMDLREMLGGKVDLIDEAGMSPRFRAHAQAEMVPL